MSISFGASGGTDCGRLPPPGSRRRPSTDVTGICFVRYAIFFCWGCTPQASRHVISAPSITDRPRTAGGGKARDSGWRRCASFPPSMIDEPPRQVSAVLDPDEDLVDLRMRHRLARVVRNQILFRDVSDIGAFRVFGEEVVERLVLARPYVLRDR